MRKKLTKFLKIINLNIKKVIINLIAQVRMLPKNGRLLLRRIQFEFIGSHYDIDMPKKNNSKIKKASKKG